MINKSNAVYCGDCLEQLKRIESNSIDLIYLDPPFFSKKDYEGFWLEDKRYKFKFTDKDWGNVELELNEEDLKEYNTIAERWEKGIKEYVVYLKKRLEQCYRILKDTGSIYVHLDWHIVHYMKIEMDKIFGYNNFRNEIIWHYGSRMMHIDSAFNRKHDTILFYSKSKESKIKMPTTPWTLKEYEQCRRKKVKYDKDGNPYIIETSDPKHKKKVFYIEETLRRGKAIDDVWDINIIPATSKERMGYPTQKPEELLERIILASSNKGDIVLDPFCGCGTSISVAHRLGRRFIGIDISKKASKVMVRRLKNNFQDLNVDIIGGETIGELKRMDPHVFAERMIVDRLSGYVNPKKSGDLGIDGWIDFMGTPVQVKRWGNKVGRPEIDKFLTAVKRDRKNKGMIIAFEFSKNCWNEVNRIREEEEVEIELKTVKDILK